eukprot:scaffold18130_cov119-Isochrysis_galbana.AAC.2
MSHRNLLSYGSPTRYPFSYLGHCRLPAAQCLITHKNKTASASASRFPRELLQAREGWSLQQRGNLYPRCEAGEASA